MLNNETRRELLNRAKAVQFPGSIMEVYRASEQGIDLLADHEAQMQQEMQVAQTQQQQETGLREEHARGNTQASMAFPNVQPNQSFNTEGMAAPINVDKYSNQGHLVESYKNVPPGIKNLPTGPYEGTVIETPAEYQTGGLRNHMMNYLHNTGRDTTYVNTVMNAIGQHESKNNPDQVQVSGNKTDGFYDGPGRGKYQFETGPEKGGNTAMNRTANFLKHNTDKTIHDFPNMNETYNASNSLDFTNLSKKDQDALFIGDKIFGGVPRRNAFDAVTRNRTTPPTQEETFNYWLNNHKGKVNGKNIVDLTEKEIEAERKKWNNRTKGMFQKGGVKEQKKSEGRKRKYIKKYPEGGLKLNSPLLKRNDFSLAARNLEHNAFTPGDGSTGHSLVNRLEGMGDDLSKNFNFATNPTLLNTKKLNLKGSFNADPGAGWDASNKAFSTFGSPTLNPTGAASFDLAYRPTKKTTLNAGVDYKTGSSPYYRAGLNIKLKRGGYRKKYL
jgi:hypothetical protein